MQTPAHSLEPNLILCFIYLAGKSLGVSEADVLNAASHDDFGYLSSWADYSLLLRRAHWAMRPINVAFKPKWLRETAASLQVLREDENESPSVTLMLVRQLHDLGLLYDAFVKVGVALLRRVAARSTGSQSAFDVAAAIVITLKMIYGLKGERGASWLQS